jgi:hypothetical protein
VEPRFFSNPTSSFGYYRGAPLAGGYGSGQGPKGAGMGQFAQGQGPVNNTSQWSPTILYMFALILVEMVVFGFLAKQI